MLVLFRVSVMSLVLVIVFVRFSGTTFSSIIFTVIPSAFVSPVVLLKNLSTTENVTVNVFVLLLMSVDE